MAEQTSISGPVRIESDSSSRVAYDLMTRIVGQEVTAHKDRAYFLTLYSQCRQVVNGTFIEGVSPKIT